MANHDPQPPGRDRTDGQAIRGIMPMPSSEDIFPMEMDHASRLDMVQALVTGITLVLRRRKGQWPTTCEVLYWLSVVGLDIYDTDDTPEAGLWMHYARRTETARAENPFGVLYWDEGPEGVVRVVVPAAMQEDVEAWLAATDDES